MYKIREMEGNTWITDDTIARLYITRHLVLTLTAILEEFLDK